MRFPVDVPVPSPTRRWQPWLVGFVIWTVLGLLSAVQTSIYYVRDGRPGASVVEFLVVWRREASGGLRIVVDHYAF